MVPVGTTPLRVLQSRGQGRLTPLQSPGRPLRRPKSLSPTCAELSPSATVIIARALREETESPQKSPGDQRQMNRCTDRQTKGERKEGKGEFVQQKDKACRKGEARTKTARNTTCPAGAWARTRPCSPCAGTVPSVYKAFLILTMIHQADIPGSRPSQQGGNDGSVF